MSLGTCLADLRARQLISDERANELQPVYDELVLQYEGRYGRPAAESMATAKALEMAETDALHRKRQSLLQAQKQGEWLAMMRQASPEGGPFDGTLAGDLIVDMDNHALAIRKQGFQMLYGLLSTQRKNLRGQVRNPEELAETMQEIFGRDTGNVNAREIAEAWKQTSEYLRSRFNAAGGRIAKLDSWHVPQRHDMRSVRDAGFETWRNDLLPLLDRSQMIDRDTGLPMSDGKLEIMLTDMYQAIASDGWSRKNPGEVHGGAVANRRADHRVLHFAGADEWASYAEKYGGGGTAFDAMVAHVESMSREIAAMERMGPNPAATLRFQKDALHKEAESSLMTGRDGQKATDDAESSAKNLDLLFDEFTGANSKPVRRRLALGFSIFRSQQTAAKLGSAMLSVGGDFGLMVQTSRFNGLPASKVLGRYLKMMNPLNTADRAQAARHVLMADQWADGHATQWRATGEEMAHEGARRMATGVLRMSGLVAHTDIAQQAFGMELVSHLTHMRDRSFGKLESSFQAMLQRYDIGEAQWDRLRSVQPESYKGTDWIYPDTIAGTDQKIADNYMRMLVTEAAFAVPVPDLRTRALINSGAKKGTWMGEITRSAFLFKGFPITVMNMHGRRMLDQGMKGKAQLAGVFAARYGVSLMMLTTMGGALSIQMKEISKGRDPRKMNDAKFWGAASLQGGGLGIFGDLLATSENRFGGGIEQTLAGPGAQTVNNIGSLTVGNAVRSLDGDPDTETTAKRDMAKLIMSETPGISLWYARAAVDRLLGDMVNEWAYGEDFEARNRRLEQYAEEQGTAYFAPPGGGQTRAPNFGNVVGAEPEGESPFQ